MPEEQNIENNATDTEPSLEDFNQPAEPSAKTNEAEPKPVDAEQPKPVDEPKPAEQKTQPAQEEDAYANLVLDSDAEGKGIKIDEEALKSFKEIAKTNNITPEVAKSIFDLQLKTLNKQIEDFKALQESWANASKVVYGDNLKNVETNCSRVLAELDKDGKFKELLALAGAEKHPATLGFLKAVGDKLLEKPAVNPNATVSGEEYEPELEDFN